ncbi:MAG: DUF72 domain-containing protein [Candidatus Zixiibacteriota bacterium]
MSGRIHIGTSGWNYGGWAGILYPEELKSKDFLSYYAQQFSTVEVNYSFYHLPRPTTYEKWVRQTPAGFVFALKLSRFITHVKRLQGVKQALRTFVKNAESLDDKCGPILFQLPPSFSLTAENKKRLRDILESATKQGVRSAVELRHQTWFVDDVYELLQRVNTSLVIANSSRYPNPPEYIATTNFVYFRFHGPKELFASSYTKAQLEHYADIMKTYLRADKDVYAYFNNDFGGHAVRNARTLKGLVSA